MKPDDLPDAALDASPTMLAAATLLMMTRFAESPDADAAAAVIEHLEIVADDERADPLMREVCAALSQRWQGQGGELCPIHGASSANSSFHH